MSDDLLTLDAVGLAEGIREKRFSPVEVLKRLPGAHRRGQSKLNAIVTMIDGAREHAQQAEAAIMRGESWGPLHGVPFTVKDCVDTAGTRTTAARSSTRTTCPTRTQLSSRAYWTRAA